MTQVSIKVPPATHACAHTYTRLHEGTHVALEQINCYSDICAHVHHGRMPCVFLGCHSVLTEAATDGGRIQRDSLVNSESV